MAAKVVFLVMAILVASCAPAFGDRRLYADATAVANSVANSNGGSSVVNSNANAQSTGSPTTAVATGTGTAGPGQNVVVNCNAFAKDSTEYKNCVNSPSPNPSTSTVSFDSAPPCNVSSPNATCYVKDSQGRCWNYENGRSCAYKDASGKPLNETQINAARAAAHPPVGSVAPSPSPSPSPSPKAPSPATASGRRRRRSSRR